MDARMKSVEKDLAKTKQKLARAQGALAKASGGALAGNLSDTVDRRAERESKLERENDFSIYCVFVEAKLIRTNFALLGLFFFFLASFHASRTYSFFYPVVGSFVRGWSSGLTKTYFQYV